MIYSVTNYSMYDNWTVTTDSRNVSSIMSKMVERAGRICERYASDIYYTLQAYYQAVQNGEGYDKVLLFREDGVSCKPVSNDTVEVWLDDSIQCWRLSWNEAARMSTISSLARTDATMRMRSWVRRV